jgi:uncharacterized protein (TIGR03437 family)
LISLASEFPDSPNGRQRLTAVVPDSVAARTGATVHIEVNGVSTNNVTVASAPAVPVLFSPQGSPYLAKVQRGGIITLWATGLGETDPQTPAGQLAGAARTRLPVSVMIGGTPAAVFYAGTAPGYAGLYQLNVQVPANIEPPIPYPGPSHFFELVVMAGNAATSALLWIE